MFFHTLKLHGQEFPSESLAAPAAAVTFNFVPTPDIGSVSSLAAESEQDIWATSTSNSLALHFDGSRWVKLPMAKAGRE
jgi:threonine aldolase